jgi:hypothetical protein
MQVSSALRIGFWLTGSWFAAFNLHAQEPAPADKPAAVNEAKGVPARATPGDYQGMAQAGSLTVAAEFMGHGVPTTGGVYSTEDYVVVEVGLFGPADARVKISAENFSLRIKGKKAPLPSVPAEVVLKSLTDPNWIPPEAPDAKSKSSSFGTGGGANQDNTPPIPPKMPIPLRHVMSQHVLNSELLQGDRALPQAGLLFFQYHGKPESIRSLELIYNGAAGQAMLKLQP